MGAAHCVRPPPPPGSLMHTPTAHAEILTRECVLVVVSAGTFREEDRRVSPLGRARLLPRPNPRLPRLAPGSHPPCWWLASPGV